MKELRIRVNATYSIDKKTVLRCPTFWALENRSLLSQFMPVSGSG